MTLTVFRGPILLSLAAAVFAVAPSVQAQTPVPVPMARAVVATANSKPFLASEGGTVPMDLAKRGYVEAEFLISGSASVYDWPAGASAAPRSRGAYTTRILVRRPANPRAFSGVVVVEPMFTARRWDWPMMWGYLRDEIVARGDAWVGITLPTAMGGLQKFAPDRYGALQFANPNPQERCPGQAAAAPIEDGLRWDVMSQVAALLKNSGSNVPVRVMGPLVVRAAYMTMQGGDLTTYLAAIHRQAVLTDGRHPYDGFIARPPFALSRINQCAAAPAAGDPRQVIRNAGVPVIAVLGEGDLGGAARLRREDSDAPDDRFRWIEVAGAGHIDRDAYAGFPSLAAQAAAGNAQGTVDWPFAAPCTPAIPLAAPPILRLGYHVALNALDEWVRHGIAPPRVSRIEVRTEGTPAVGVDEFGNARGGLRTPYLDVPTATYATSSPGPGTCAEMGHTVAFTPERLASVYGDLQSYARRVTTSIASLQHQGVLTARDANRLRRELVDDARPAWRDNATR